MIDDFRFDEFFEMVIQKQDIIARAQQLGTLNDDDRSRQYTYAEAPQLLRSLNEAWTRIRQLQKGSTAKDSEILALKKQVRLYKFANVILTSIITGLAWEGLKLLVHAMFQ